MKTKRGGGGDSGLPSTEMPQDRVGDGSTEWRVGSGGVNTRSPMAMSASL